MKRIILWTLGVAGGLAILAIIMAYNNRLWSLWGTTIREGTVTNIQPIGQSNTPMPQGYLVKLRLADEKICLFPTYDQHWAFVGCNDQVKVKLFRSPAWSVENGPWQDGTLLTKTRPEPVRIAPKRKFTPLADAVTVGIGAAFLGALVIAENRRQRKNKSQAK